MFNFHGRTRQSRECAMTAVPGLDTGLFVCGDDKLIAFQEFSFPPAFIQVKNATGLDRKLRITGVYPRPVLPRPNGIFIEPTPHRFVTDRRDYAGRADMSRDIRSTPPGQGNAHCCWQLTRECLYFHHHFWGGKPGGAPGGLDRQVLPSAGRRISFSRKRPLRVAYPAGRQFHCFASLHGREGQSSRVELNNTLTYTSSLDTPARHVPRQIKQSYMDYFLACSHPFHDAKMPEIAMQINHLIR